MPAIRMRCRFEEDPIADISQIERTKLASPNMCRPLLPPIKNVSVAFNSASAMILTIPGGGQKFIIKA